MRMGMDAIELTFLDFLHESEVSVWLSCVAEVALSPGKVEYLVLEYR
jgi:hypothetical protein